MHKNFLPIIFLLFTQLVLSQNENIMNDSVPGILVDAGGHKLHLNVQGKGSPTVIFENENVIFWN